MGFTAGLIEPLDWDFTKFKAGQGVIPEPDDEAIDTLFDDLTATTRNLMRQAASLPEDATPEEVMLALSSMPETAGIGYKDMVSGMTKAFAKVTQGHPSEAQMNKLPMRERLAFFSWLAGELRPEASGAGTRSQVPAAGRPGQPALRIARGA